MLGAEWKQFFAQKLANSSASNVNIKKKVKRESKQPLIKKIIPKKKNLDEIVQKLQNDYQNLEIKEEKCFEEKGEEEEENEDEEEENNDELNDSSDEYFVTTFFNPNNLYLDLHNGKKICNFEYLYDQMKKKKSINNWEQIIVSFTHGDDEETLSLLNLLLLSGVYKINAKLFQPFDECLKWNEMFKNNCQYGSIQISLSNNKMKTNNKYIYYIVFNLDKFLSCLDKNCTNAFYQFVIFILYVLIRELVSLNVKIPIYIVCNNYNLKLPFQISRKHYFIDYILSHAWFNCWQTFQLEQYNIGGVKRKKNG
jgi:hypothetical protein